MRIPERVDMVLLHYRPERVYGKAEILAVDWRGRVISLFAQGSGFYAN
jgi:hypothetical protein